MWSCLVLCKARLNTDADFLATEYQSCGRQQSIAEGRSCWYVSTNGKHLINQIEFIHFHINGIHMQQCMQELRNRNYKTWEDTVFRVFGKHFMVDWDHTNKPARPLWNIYMVKYQLTFVVAVLNNKGSWSFTSKKINLNLTCCRFSHHRAVDPHD